MLNLEKRTNDELVALRDQINAILARRILGDQRVGVFLGANAKPETK